MGIYKQILIISFLFCFFTGCITSTDHSEKVVIQNTDSVRTVNNVIEKPVKTLNTVNYNIKNEMVDYNSISFEDIIKKLPTVGNNFHLRVKNEMIKIDDNNSISDFFAVKLPDTLIYSLSDTIKYFEIGTLRKERPLKYKQQFLDSINSSTDIVLYFYFLIDLNSDYYTIFSSVNEMKEENIRYREWTILTFDKNYSLVSKTIRTNNFYVINDTIHSIWWDASDPECLYDKWTIDSAGQFHLSEYEEKLPEALKNYSKEFNVEIDNNL